MSKLAGKVAVLTGGASGIGRATVECLAAAGASVVFCDIPPAEATRLRDSLGKAGILHYASQPSKDDGDGAALAEKLGDDVVFVPADITDDAALESVFTTAVERFDRVDILVNNAGVCGDEGSITSVDPSLFDRTIAVNLRSAWLAMRHVVPLMVTVGGGSIINIASVFALRGMAGYGAYAASKAGLVQLGSVAAMELASEHIRVNAICPGSVLTPMHYANDAIGRRDPADAAKMLRHAAPIPRAGQPDDIAYLAAFLASDDSSFITGQTISVDGGATAEFDSRPRMLSALDLGGMGGPQ
ncbi:NAD(P)-dependent dehydrogenase (short-subunit alcohol dehydrogenase family) [Tamaricihabitans halophyticus]|uniref:NAD(P)-dependent dehydrogenase (Short-subunit alcohol dehydrogenase family) n=1 Tax=Tamaricihabitans halophyticus TaxID=1262583 RepID=A0A4R2QW34_9PSEU|nr:SDR family NAD(P)-dependent oxidoreductase [Tamaricihabitans halophyticus]TCP53464.1 NAD(P)-dependent dehydrogenase (short-subunit alcohol dehydrogenase family) [Tamaricihabitans halophyticus]